MIPLDLVVTGKAVKGEQLCGLARSVSDVVGTVHIWGYARVKFNVGKSPPSQLSNVWEVGSGNHPGSRVLVGFL